MLPMYSWTCGFPPAQQTYQGLQSWWILTPFPRQQPIAHSVLTRVRLHTYLPSPCWKLRNLDLAQVFRTLSQLLWVHVCSCLAVVPRRPFPSSLPSPLALALSTPSSTIIPKLWKERWYYFFKHQFQVDFKYLMPYLFIKYY